MQPQQMPFFTSPNLSRGAQTSVASIVGVGLSFLIGTYLHHRTSTRAHPAHTKISNINIDIIHHG